MTSSAGLVDDLLVPEDIRFPEGKRLGKALNGRRLVLPAILVQPRRWIAPWPVVGLGHVPAQSGENVFEGGSALGQSECLGSHFFSNLVRISLPELLKMQISRLHGDGGGGIKGGINFF